MPRDILIDPQRTGSGNPNIQFSGSSGNTLRLEVLSEGSVQFTGVSGSLFKIADFPAAGGALNSLFLSGTTAVTGSILPGVSNLYDLGSSSKVWANIFATNISGSLTGSNVLANQVVVAGTGGVLSGSNSFWWDNTNNRVGIGTNAPALGLEVRGAPGSPTTSGTTQSYGSLRLRTNTGNSQTLDFGIFNTGNYGAWIQATNSGDLSSNSPLALNPNGGGVGIGTTSAAGSTLLVSGSTIASDTTAYIRAGVPAPTSGAGVLNVQNSAGTSLFFVSGSGYIGINSSTPTFNLDVVGTGRISSTFRQLAGDAYLNQSATGNTYFYTTAYFGKQGGVGIGGANYERLSVTYSSIANEAAGTGTYTNFVINNGGNTRFNIPSSLSNALGITGSLEPDADNTRDLGSSTKRWRSLYASNVSGSLTGSNLSSGQILVAGTGGVVSGTNVFTYDGNLTISGTLKSVYSAGDEGGEIFFAKPQTNTSINTGVTIDMYQNKIRIFEAGGTNRGGYFDISTLGAGVSTNLVGGGGSSTNYWFESAANTIYTTGSAGVGTTSYTSRFYVSGSSTPSTPTMIVREGVATPTGGVGLFDVQNSAGSSLFFVSGSGNIGIGTNVPTSYISTNSTVLAIAHTGNLATVRVSSGPGLGSGNQAEFFAGASSIGIWGTTNVPMLFYTNATEKMRITAGGDVGIGTTSYTARFYVSGSSTSSTPTAVVREGVASPTGGAGTFDVQNSAGTSILFVTGSGRVGIGTITPQATFHVSNGTSPNLAQIYIGYAGSSNYYDANNHYFRDGSANSKARLDSSGNFTPATDNAQDLGSTALRWRNVYATSVSGSLTGSNVLAGQVVVAGTGGVLSGSNNFWWDNTNGRVGIGTNTPASRLDVNDTSNYTRLQIGSAYTYNTYWADYHLFKNNTLVGSTIVSINNNGLIPGTTNSYDIGSTSLIWRNIYAANISGSLTGSNVLAGQVVVAGTGGVLSGTNNLYWNNTNSYLGIGTGSPTQALHVRGSTGSDVIALVKNDGAGRAVITLDSGGSSDSNVRFLSQGVNKWSILSSPTDLGFYNYTLSSYAMFIAGSTGNVGVNTTTSTAKFTISGSSTASTPTMLVKEGVVSPTGGALAFEVENSAGGTILAVTGSGLVGINTAIPNAQLAVYNASLPTFTLHNSSNYTRLASSGNDFYIDTGLGGTAGATIFRRGSGTAEHVRFDSSGNVGIGTSVFADKLAVNGSMSVTGSLLPGSDGSYTLGSSSKRWSEVRGVNIYGQFFPTSGTPGSVLYVNSSGLAAQDNSNFFWNDSTKQLGIGTASPATKLSVYSGAVSANYGVFSGSLAAYASSTGALYTYWNTTSNYGTIVSVADNSGNAAPMQLRVGGTLSTHIDSTGNVGIGTTSPFGAKLAVYGGTLPSGGSGASNLSFATNLSAGRLASGGGGSDVSIINTYFDSSTVELSAGTTSGYVSGITAGARTSPANDSVTIYTRSAEKIRVYGASSLMSVTASIEPGTDNTYDLGSSTKRWRTLYATSISGSITGSNVSAGQVVVAGTGGVLSGSNLLFWDNTNSRLGIGTATPGYALDVYNGSVKINKNNYLIIGNDTNDSIIVNDGPALFPTTNNVVTFNTYAGAWNFRDSQASKARLTILADTGNVGVGTTNPTAVLHVTGSSTASTQTMLVREGVASPTGGALAFEVENSAGTTILAVSGSGRVGIATTPSATIANAKLEVNGSVVPTTHLGSGNNIGESTNYWGTSYLNYGYFYNGSTNSIAINAGTFQVYSQTSPTSYSIYADTNNRVGIGAAAISTARLLVSGTSTTTDTTLLVKHGTANGSALAVINAQNSSGTSLLFLSGSGAVGIGTSTLVASGLTVSDVANINNPARLNLRQDNSDVGNRLATVSFNSNAVSIYTAAESTGIANNTLAYFHYNYSIFYTGTTATNPSERLRIDSGGNVGIGTTNPNGNRLAISGGNLSVTGSALPGVDNTYDLGSSSYRWKQVNMVSGSMVSGSISSLTYTPISTGGSYTRNYLAGESGRLTATKSIAAATNTTFFTITANNGATLVDVSFVVSESGFSVARKYTVASQSGNTSANVVSFKTVDTGPYGGYDLTVTFTKSSSAVTTCTVSHNYTTTTNIAMTLDVSAVSSGGSPTTVTIF